LTARDDLIVNPNQNPVNCRRRTLLIRNVVAAELVANQLAKSQAERVIGQR